MADMRYEMTGTTSDVIKTTLLNRVSWGAVFAGVVVALAVQLVLNLVGVGVGAATYDVFTNNAGFSWGAAIWWTISGIVSSFAGGYTAGRLAGEPKKCTASWHGFVSWATALLVVAVLMTTAAGTMIHGPYRITAYDGNSFLARTEAGVSTNARNDNVRVTARRGAPADTASADVDADSVAIVSLMSAVALILGALASIFGGCAGTVHPANAAECHLGRKDSVRVENTRV